VTNKLIEQRNVRCAFVGVSGAFIGHGMRCDFVKDRPILC
jgi:hypothetical protein